MLPRSRDIRITLYPVCSDEAGAARATSASPKRAWTRCFTALGEPVQFYVREDADDEQGFLQRRDWSRTSCRHSTCGPIRRRSTTPRRSSRRSVEGSELRQSTLIERLAAQLDVDFKGLTLIGKPGERIQFGCSNRIRHTLAPDNSSLTFATAEELINHWLCVLSFDIRRDWTWDGLADAGITVSRTRQFTGEAATHERSVVGQVEWRKTASRIATTKPDRSHTRVVFVDAVEPKKDLGMPATLPHPFPNTIDVSYTLTPAFIGRPSDRRWRARSGHPQRRGAGHDDSGAGAEDRRRGLRAVAVSAEPRVLARRPSASDSCGSSSKSPIEDPNDTYFARVLGYAPDPLLALPNPDQLPGSSGRSAAGHRPRADPGHHARAGQRQRRHRRHAVDDRGNAGSVGADGEDHADHYLLPLPPGLHAESPELFGFFTYELRVGHTQPIWCTAHGRFGHPTRLSGVQHPAPPLKVLVDRTPGAMSVTAPFAVAVFNGRNVTSRPPKTEIWCMLYAQVLQADAAPVAQHPAGGVAARSASSASIRKSAVSWRDAARSM